jgi:hypothetical protein
MGEERHGGNATSRKVSCRDTVDSLRGLRGLTIENPHDTVTIQ